MRYWIIVSDRVDALSMRERGIIFAATAFMLIASVNELLLAPLWEKQKVLSAQVVQKQEYIKEQQAQRQHLLQARNDDENSPLRQHFEELKQQLQGQSEHLDEQGARLTAPSMMAELLGRVLSQNERVQLVELKTLPVAPLNAKPSVDGAVMPVSANGGARQLFKHGVQISVRGSYIDLLRYTAALENMPARMFWGEASLSVEKYPDAVLKLTVYTLSLEQTWLAI